MFKHGINIDLRESRGLKGFSMVLVIIHHFTQHYADNLPSLLLTFRGVGAIACALFFFLSGYGLSMSNKQKDSRYWLRRFMKIYAPFVMANLIFMIYEMCSGDYVWQGIGYLLANLIGIILVTPAYWFIPCIMCMYLAFAFSRGVWGKIGLSFLFGGAFTIALHAPGSLSWLAFPLGIVVARKKEQIRLGWLQYGLCLLLFIASFSFYYQHDMVLSWERMPIFACMLLTFPIVCLKVKSLFHNVIFRYIGENSLDFYLMHFIGLLLVEKFFPSYPPLWAFLLMVVFVAILCYMFRLLRYIIVDKIIVRL